VLHDRKSRSVGTASSPVLDRLRQVDGLDALAPRQLDTCTYSHAPGRSGPEQGSDGWGFSASTGRKRDSLVPVPPGGWGLLPRRLLLIMMGIENSADENESRPRCRVSLEHGRRQANQAGESPVREMPTSGAGVRHLGGSRAARGRPAAWPYRP
jgi:hypothetical protein